MRQKSKLDSKCRMRMAPRWNWPHDEEYVLFVCGTLLCNKAHDVLGECLLFCLRRVKKGSKHKQF